AALLPRDGSRYGGNPFPVFRALSQRGRKSMDADGRTSAILVMCDDAPSAEALVTHITKRLGDIVYAANKSEALRQLAQCRLDAAGLARQAGTGALAAGIGGKGIPCWVFGQSSCA